MTTCPQSPLALQLRHDLERGDPAGVAYHLGSIVCNDDRVRDAIRTAMAKSADPVAVVQAVAAVLTKSSGHFSAADTANAKSPQLN